MKVPVGGAARIAAIVDAYEHASRAWSNLSPEIQASAEGEELKRRLDTAGANLAILEELSNDCATPIMQRRPNGSPWQQARPGLR